MYIALSCMFIGVIVGWGLRRVVKFSISPAIMVVICLLLFVLGMELGLNKELVSKFAHIGVSALVISVLAVAGSCFTAKFFYRYIVKKGEKR